MIYGFIEYIFVAIEKNKAEECYRLIEKIRESSDPKEIDILLHKLADKHFWLSPIAFPVFDKQRELCIEKVEPIIARINESSDVDELRNLYQEASYWASWSITSELSDLINDLLKDKIYSSEVADSKTKRLVIK